MRRRFFFATLPLSLACVALVGCTGGKAERSYAVRVNGDPRHGKELIQAYGCGACHIIPGVRTARGLVGPPLILFAERTMIAGELPNTPDNLVRWLENPSVVESGTAMPDLGLTPDEAYDIAAYLYTLR
ncbi:MAG TPA: c-type cytochrome [Candidatus Acidoferrales bacterium]|jgi:cytochrome c2|nr:c-type cytochrome [Candidatus Acidoferrales bacterium]